MPTPIIYSELRDHRWVAIQLQKMSMRQLADKIDCPHSCVRWIVERYLTDEEKKAMFYERRPHKNWKPPKKGEKIKSNKDEGI